MSKTWWFPNATDVMSNTLRRLNESIASWSTNIVSGTVAKKVKHFFFSQCMLCLIAQDFFSTCKSVLYLVAPCSPFALTPSPRNIHLKRCKFFLFFKMSSEICHITRVKRVANWCMFNGITRVQLCWPNIRICVCIFPDLSHRQDVICIVILCSRSELLAFVFLLIFLQS